MYSLISDLLSSKVVRYALVILSLLVLNVMYATLTGQRTIFHRGPPAISDKDQFLDGGYFFIKYPVNWHFATQAGEFPLKRHLTVPIGKGAKGETVEKSPVILLSPLSDFLDSKYIFADRSYPYYNVTIVSIMPQKDIRKAAVEFDDEFKDSMPKRIIEFMEEQLAARGYGPVSNEVFPGAFNDRPAQFIYLEADRETKKMNKLRSTIIVFEHVTRIFIVKYDVWLDYKKEAKNRIEAIVNSITLKERNY